MWTELYDLDEDSSCVAILYELRNRSLVSLVDKRIIKVDGDGDYSCFFVKQHDLLRELAIYQSKQNCIEHRERVLLEMCGDNLPKWWNDNKSPIKARLLSISTDGEFSVKLPYMDFPQVEILVLNFRTQNYALPVFVKEMKELKVLVVQNTGTSFTTPVNDFHMLGALLNLRRIRLDSISLSCITENPTELESVQKLSLRHCVNFADGFQKISYTFPNLMEIYIDMCFMEKLPAELGNLIHLIKLSICAASELSLMPKEIGKLVNLEVLKVRSCMRLAIPESIGDLNKLVFLDICGCVSMKKLPENLCKLMSLRKLKITACYELSALPKGLGNLVNLEVLSLRWCTELLQLPVSITNLKKLNTLDIHDCRKLEELPEHIGNLTSLRSLDMSRCMKMLKLPQSVSNLDQLEEVICEPWTQKFYGHPSYQTSKTFV